MANRLLIRVRVMQTRDVADRVKELRLEPLYRTTMPAFQPGDHVRLRLPDAALRTFSLCGSPEDLSTYRIAVLREETGRGASRTIHDTVQVGDEIHVSYPEPGLRLVRNATEHILIAGGVGITPFMPMALTSKPGIHLHYAARSRSAAAFLPQLRRHLGDRLHTYMSTQGRSLDIKEAIGEPRTGAHIYACGPERLLTAVDVIATQTGWAANTVHIESFSGPPATEASRGHPFEVTLLLSGRDVTVPADKSLLQTLRDEGIPVDYSCEGGVCGTCWLEYRDGDPIHRDRYLTPTEHATKIMTCVSRANTHLTLLA